MNLRVSASSQQVGGGGLTRRSGPVGGDPSPPGAHCTPLTYSRGGLQGISRYHRHGHARLAENLHRFLHAGPRRVDDSDETQKSQPPQLGSGSQGQH